MLNSGITVNCEWGRMWKETAMVCLKVLCHHLHQRSEENHYKPQSEQLASELTFVIRMSKVKIVYS
jgi:hypothetical protein